MTFVALGPNGEETCLPQPVQVRFNCREDAPADALNAVFPWGGGTGAAVGIRVYDKNRKLCFDGIVDEQRLSCAGRLLLTLNCRSRAALLLDNEAIPQIYAMVSLPIIFARHIEPYGFTAYKGPDGLFQGVLTVEKGMSEWQAAAQFCKRFLKTVPRICGSVFDASGEIPGGRLVFGNGGVPFSALTVQNRYCERYSQLLIPSGGTFPCAVRDGESQGLGVLRRRILTKNQDARAVERLARRRAFSVLLECPGEVPAQLCENAEVRNSPFGDTENLVVSEVDYCLDSRGEKTRLILRRQDECGFQDR